MELAGLRLRNGLVRTSPGKTATEVTRGYQTVRFCTVLKECIEPEKTESAVPEIVLRPRYKINRCGGTGQKQTKDVNADPSQRILDSKPSVPRVIAECRS